ncbi:type II secretion system protein [Candidatus Peregrinibacteria bacterium]|nr:MAG: type II secretion system protein [Candidatus Peregrinibacteria bacterium]
MIELIVSIAIVSLLTTGMIAFSQTMAERSKRSQFQTDVEEILTFFRRARSDAIGNRLVNGEVPEGGFGVQLQKVSSDGHNKIRMTYFVDDYDNDIGGAGNDGVYTEGQDTRLEQREIQMFWTFVPRNPIPDPDHPEYPSATVDDEGAITVFFIPPNAESIINHGGDDQNDLRSIDLRFQYRETIKNICLNRISRFLEIVGDQSC